MSDVKHNPPAFPSMKPLDHWGDPFRGMDLRDWFAGQAIIALLPERYRGHRDDAELMAERIYKFADAMLKQRNKT